MGSYKNRQKMQTQENGSGDMMIPLNPFKIPAHNDIFKLREEERRLAHSKRQKERRKLVHQKHTNTTRINHQTARTRRVVLRDDTEVKSRDPLKDWTIETTKDHPFGKEGIVEYINRKREMFLVKYAITIKREEMRKLEKLARDEEEKLTLSEQALEDDALTFDQFLKENDRSSVEAIQKAELIMRAKLERVAKIKRLCSENRTIQTEICKNQELLATAKFHKEFLEEVTPVRRDAYLKLSTSETRKQPIYWKSVSRLEEDKDFEPELWFIHPNQLLFVFSELEDQNLSLVQNGQDLEESNEEMKKHANATRRRLENDLDFVIGQTKLMEQNLSYELERSENFKLKCRLFSHGDFDQADQDRLLNRYGSKIEAVYKCLVGENEANIESLQMLTSIENILGTLLDMQEQLPVEILTKYEKKLDKDRRARLRDEKVKEQEKLQLERARKALQRSQAAPTTHVDRRRLVPRSEPPKIVAQAKKETDQNALEQQEIKTFFES